MYKKIIKTFLFALAANLLANCGDENAFSAAEDKIDDAIYDQRSACYYGTSTHSDSWCCSNYGYRCYSYSSSSQYKYYSSSSAAPSYLEDAKTMVFTLNNYRQLVKFDNNSTSDGDPKISFSVTFETASGDTTKKSTGVLLKLSNEGSWSGRNSTTLTVPINTYKISVCPKVLDVDAFFDDDYSSGYCYIRSKVGLLENYETVEQTDYASSNYYLAWEWYLY